MIGGMASLLSVFIWGTPLADIVSILSVVIATMGLSLVFISPATLVVSVLAFRYGLNPDIIVYPVMSTVADILVTLCFFLTLELHFVWGYAGSYLIGLLDLVLLFLVFYILVKFRNEREFTVTLKEFFLALVVVTFIVSITGNMLGKISEVIGSRREIYFVYPSLMSTIGAVGSIVGSSITTKLALGMVKPSFAAVKRNMPEIGAACVSSAILFLCFAVISSFFTQGVPVFGELLRLMAMLSTVNLLAAPVMSAVAFYVAVLTYKRGLNPDNIVIPFESSLSDSVTTICLLVALNLFGGFGGNL
jgi:mgtE-like transporter